MANLTAAEIAGTTTRRNRVSHDFYATPFGATNAILDRVPLVGDILEPAAGEGHMSKCLVERYPGKVTSTELIQRQDKFNCGIQYGVDFLNHDYGRTFPNIVTNPPFNLAQGFVERSLELATDKVLIFAKIQFLEGEKRRRMFEKHPPKYVYVFSKRQNTLNNGQDVNERGKPWATVLCFAWFVWEVGYTGEPTIRWI